MFEEDSLQERTEQATEKRKRDAKSRGQVSRSREFNTMLLMFGAVLFAFLISGQVSQALQMVYKKAFVLTRNEIFDPVISYTKLLSLITLISKAFLPFLLFMLGISIFGPMLIGGLSFSKQNFFPKLERLNPVKGISRIISIRAFVELAKSLLKFALVGFIFYLIVSYKLDQILKLDSLPLDVAVSQCSSILLFGFLGMCFALVIIAGIDVPYQLWSGIKKLKMTKQEVKEEYKELEGKPEVKSRIKSTQRKISQRRMMYDVPHADVVITNPTHFAVAIKYDPDKKQAPYVVAKGADLIAQMIKKIAKHNKVPELNAPPLARSIFYNVEINQEIPQDLYMAVAKVLGYIYELRNYNSGKIKQYPTKPVNFEIPEHLKR